MQYPRLYRSPSRGSDEVRQPNQSQRRRRRRARSRRRALRSSPHTWETLHGRLTSNTAERGWRAPHGTHAGRRRARRRGRHPPWTTGDGSAAGSGKRGRHSAQLGVKVPAAGSSWPASASRSALPCSRTLDDGAPDPAAAPVAAVSTCTRRSPRCNESSSCASLRSAPRLPMWSAAEGTEPGGSGLQRRCGRRNSAPVVADPCPGA